MSVSYDGTYGADQDIPFEFAFFNEDGTPIPDIRYAYATYDESGQELARGGYDDTATPGIVAIEGYKPKSMSKTSTSRPKVQSELTS